MKFSLPTCKNNAISSETQWKHQENSSHNISQSATKQNSHYNASSLIQPSQAKIELKDNDELITNSSEFASTFNKHFLRITQVLNANSPSLVADPTSNVKIIRKPFVFFSKH